MASHWNDQQVNDFLKTLNSNTSLQQALLADQAKPQFREYDGQFFILDPKTGAQTPLDKNSPGFFNTWLQAIQHGPDSPYARGSDAIFKDYGITLPDDWEDYNLVRDQTGRYTADRDSFWTRNYDWLIPAMVVGGGLGIGAAAGFGGAEGGGAAIGPVAGGQAGGIGGAVGTGAGAGAGVGTGVGIGETGAVTGLTGSGAGGAAGAAGAAGSGAAGAAGAAGNTAGNVASGVAKGTDTAALITSLLGSTIGALGNAFSQQHRQSFSGTAADPVNTLSAINTAIGNEGNRIDLQGVQQQARQSALNNQDVPSLPTFVGGGLPMPIGVRRNTNTSSPLSRSLYDAPPTQDELDHLYSNLSIVGGKR